MPTTNNYFLRLSEAADHFQYLIKQHRGHVSSRGYLKQIGFSSREIDYISKSGKKRLIL